MWKIKQSTKSFKNIVLIAPNGEPNWRWSLRKCKALLNTRLIWILLDHWFVQPFIFRAVICSLTLAALLSLSPHWYVRTSLVFKQTSAYYNQRKISDLISRIHRRRGAVKLVRHTDLPAIESCIKDAPFLLGWSNCLQGGLRRKKRVANFEIY